jgi:hypothetical protein
MADALSSITVAHNAAGSPSTLRLRLVTTPPTPEEFSLNITGVVLCCAESHDGNIYLGGDFEIDGVPYKLAKVTPAGVVDATFAGNSYGYRVTGIRVRPTGEILVWTDSSVMLATEYLVQLGIDGLVDYSFEVSFSGHVRDCVLLGDGSVVVCGNLQTFALPSQLYVVKLMASGAPVAAFDPVFSTPIFSMALLDSGNIAIAVPNDSLNGASCDYVVEVDANGDLVRNFQLSASDAGHVQFIRAVPGGGLLALGYFSGDLQNGCLTKWNADGTQDVAFQSLTVLDLTTTIYANELLVASVDFIFGELLSQEWGGVARTAIAPIDPTSGAARADWTTDIGPYGESGGYILGACIFNGTKAVVVGEFDTIGGVPRTKAAIVDIATGEVS